VAAAYVYSAISTLQGVGHVYFEVGCITLVAVTLGRWLEATGKWKATDALKSLAKLLPETVRIIRDDRQSTCALAEVQPGDELRILPGERLPIDGRIVRGIASIDEQLVTGESQPVDKSRGDVVFGGTLNLDGDLIVAATATPSGGALARLMDAVAEAAVASSRWQRLADRVSFWFLPLVLLFAIGAFIAQLLLYDFQHALLTSLAIVLIACPCALGVATPLAIWAALGAASRRGILFRDGDAIERMAAVTSICLDKTGTLTDGALHVAQFIAENATDTTRSLEDVALLVAGSNHVMSQAIAHYLQDQDVIADCAMSHGEVFTVPGCGLALYAHDGAAMYLGSLRLMHERKIVIGEGLERQLNTPENAERSCCYFARDGRVQGVFLFHETVRPTAVAMLTAVRDMQIDACILTGDREGRARLLAERFGVPVQAGLLPEEKLQAIRRRQAGGHVVAMIGDGMNDAPALAAADVGIALGCGADISREAADVCLIHNDLSAVPLAIRLAQATRRTIRQNLFWAFGYNVVGMLLAASGWLNPIWASIAMVGSSLFVVSNSLRLSQQFVTNRNLGDRLPSEKCVETIAPEIGRTYQDEAVGSTSSGARDYIEVGQ
jgi:heavy metal translocating P-type ATPase